jgi:hypothetical protein
VGAVAGERLGSLKTPGTTLGVGKTGAGLDGSEAEEATCVPRT